MTSLDSDGNVMSDDELCDTMRTLVLGGHDTTASTLSWALERISRHPAILDRLDAAVRDNDDDYIDAVIKETMRLRPAFPLTARLAAQDFDLPGLTIPAGTMIVPYITLVHRHPTCMTTRTPSAPNASSTARSAPTNGSPSAAAAAASEQPSHNSKPAPSCARSCNTPQSNRRPDGTNASDEAPSSSSRPSAQQSPSLRASRRQRTDPSVASISSVAPRLGATSVGNATAVRVLVRCGDGGSEAARIRRPPSVERFDCGRRVGGRCRSWFRHAIAERRARCGAGRPAGLINILRRLSADGAGHDTSRPA